MIECKVKFPQDAGAWTDISTVITRDYSLDFALFNSAFKHVRNSFKGSIPYDPVIFQKLFDADEDIEFYFKEDGNYVFTGIINPDFNQKISTTESDIITLNVIDYSDKLDVPLQNTYYYTATKNPASGLLVRPNISTYLTQIITDVNIFTGNTIQLKSPLTYDPVIGITAYKKGDKAGEVLEQLCFEYGLQYYFTQDGKIDLIKWSTDTESLFSTYEFSEANKNINDGSFTIKKDNNDTDSIKVIYSKPLENKLEGKESWIVPNNYVMKTITPGDKWPSDEEEKTFHFIYNPLVNQDDVSVNDKEAIAITAKKIRLYIQDRNNSGSIDKGYEVFIDPLNSPSTIVGFDVVHFQLNPSSVELQLQLRADAFTGTSYTKRLINSFGVYGGVVWRWKSALTSVNYGPTKSIEDYTAKYIHSKEDSDNLAALIKNNNLLNKTISFSSYENTALGQTVNILLPSKDITLKALLLSKSYDHKSREYSYEALTLTGIDEIIEENIPLVPGDEVDESPLKTQLMELGDFQNLSSAYADLKVNFSTPLAVGINDLTYDELMGRYYLSLSNGLIRDNFYYSTDLKNWQVVPNLPAYFYANGTGLKRIKENGRLVVSGFITDGWNNKSYAVLFSDDNGFTWTKTLLANSPASVRYDITFHNERNLYYAFDADTKAVYSSSDLVTWSSAYAGVINVGKLVLLPNGELWALRYSTKYMQILKADGTYETAFLADFPRNLFYLDNIYYVHLWGSNGIYKSNNPLTLGSFTKITVPNNESFIQSDVDYKTGLLSLVPTGFASVRPSLNLTEFGDLVSTNKPANVASSGSGITKLLNNRFIFIGTEESGSYYAGRLWVLTSPLKTGNKITGGTEIKGELVLSGSVSSASPVEINAPSLSFNGTKLGEKLISPKRIKLEEDFIGYLGASSVYPYPFLNAGVISAGTINQTAVTYDICLNHIGLLGITDSTTANGGGFVKTGNTFHLSNGGYKSVTIFRPMKVVSVVTTRIGFHNATTITAPTMGTFFECVSDGTLWVCTPKNVLASVATNGTAFNLSPNEWYTALVEIGLDGSTVSYKVFKDDGTIITDQVITSTLTNTQIPFNIISTQSTTDAGSPLLWIDYVSLEVTRDLNRIIV